MLLWISGYNLIILSHGTAELSYSIRGINTVEIEFQYLAAMDSSIVNILVYNDVTPDVI